MTPVGMSVTLVEEFFKVLFVLGNATQGGGAVLIS